MANWTKNISYTCLRSFFRLTFFAIGLVFIAVTGLLTKLYMSPLDLRSFKPKLEQYLARQLPQVAIHFSQCDLTWLPQDGGLVLNLGKAEVIDVQTQGRILSAKKLILDFHLLQLILQEKDAYKLVLVNPSLTYQFSETLERGSLRIPRLLPGIEIRNGKFDLRAGKNHWQASQINLSLRRKGSRLYLDSVIPLSLATARVSAHIQLRNHMPDTLSIRASARNCDFKDLEEAWPEWLAPAPRNWVLQHIQQGQSEHAELNAVLKKTDEDIELISLGGHLDIRHAKVNYLTGLPTVEGVNGQARFDQDNFWIDIHSGLSNGMSITAGDIVIKGLSQKDQSIEIGLKVLGPVEKGLAFLSKKPIDLLSSFNVSTQGTTGHSVTNLQLAFPLHNQLKLSDIKATGTSTLTDVSLPQAVRWQEKAIPLTAKSLKLDLGTDSITIKGNIHFLNENADVTWAYDFAQAKTSYLVNGRFNTRSLKKANLDPPTLYQGSLALQLALTQKHDLITAAQFSADLTQGDVVLPGIGVISQQDKKCVVEGSLSFEKGRISDIQYLKIFGDHINLNFSKLPAANSYVARNAVWRGSQSQITLNLAKEATKVKFSGKKLVIYPDRTQKKAADLPAVDIDLALDLEQLVIFSQGTLHHVKAFYAQRGKQITRLQAEAQQERSNDWLKAYTDEKGQIFITSDNVESLCRFLDIGANLEGGTLNAQIMPYTNGHLEGRLAIRDTYMNQKSPLAKLVGHASPLGLIDAVRGKDIYLDQIKANFYIQDGTIIVKEGSAAGHTIGFTFKGSVNAQEIKMYGTMMPVNFINKAISWLPIIGNFFDEGFFGITYRLKGDPKNPHISFNPLSAFAPGAFKQIFAKESWSQIPQEKKANQPAN